MPEDGIDELAEGSKSRKPRRGKTRQAKASERLARLLVIVPYLVEHPGTHIDVAARLFGVDRDALVDDLKVVFLSGLPPYSPGDLIDVELDEDGTVSIRMADHFSRPLRLTRHEALSLYLQGTALVGTPGVPEATALTSALAKLREGIGDDTLGAAERVEAAEAGRPAELLDTIREAAAARERVEIVYVALSTGEESTRTVDPEEVFSSLGNWYVAAWDHSRDEERLFRADRMRSVRSTGETFEPRGLEGAGRPLYSPGERDVQVRLVLKPEARWIAEYHPVDEAAERADGQLEVALRAKELDWAARLVLRVAPYAEVLAPQTLQERVKGLARRTREQYF
ncbi:MAG: WYL domain-containing protein [Actinomycetota bacterium]